MKSHKLKNVEDPKKIKRPIKFDQDLANEICLTIATTTKTLSKLYKKYKHWPLPRTIYRWAFENKDFCHQYARAKSFQVEWIVEEAREIANDGTQDTYIDEKGHKRCDNEWIARSRLRVDTIKWLASKLAPKLYGEKVETTQQITIEEVTRTKKAIDAYVEEK